MAFQIYFLFSKLCTKLYGVDFIWILFKTLPQVLENQLQLLKHCLSANSLLRI